MDYQELARLAKEDSHVLATTSHQKRNQALAQIAQSLEEKSQEIFHANALDLEESDGLPQPIVSRLKFDRSKLDACLAGIHDLIAMEDPLFRVLFQRQLDESLILKKITCPIGVIGVIFESRPDALVQIAALCLKSGNSAILKGGKEATHTNRMLFDIIHEAGVTAQLPPGFLTLVEGREGIDRLLAYDQFIDLIIPRGSNEFVQYIMANSKIPVMGHADGICHLYVDQKADLSQALDMIVDAKTQYPAACNAVETLLIHEDHYQTLLEKLKETAISITVAEGPEDYREHLDTILTVKSVTSLEEAVTHINTYGSHHTDGILSTDSQAIDQFMDAVDSAGVYANCSTRFADGYRYGFGAEVGISTGKLHARGPVGLDGLITYKYQLRGQGQRVADYANGQQSFDFKDIPF